MVLMRSPWPLVEKPRRFVIKIKGIQDSSLQIMDEVWEGCSGLREDGLLIELGAAPNSPFLDRVSNPFLVGIGVEKEDS